MSGDLLQKLVDLGLPEFEAREILFQSKNTDPSQKKIFEIARRRLGGEPLFYILGKRCFRNHDYQVGPGVLVPRPETEILVELAAQILRPIEQSRLFEVGLGSGAISLELLAEFPGLQCVGTEASPDAQKYCEINRRQILGPDSIQDARLEIHSCEASHVLENFQSSNWASRFHLFVSNPPYLSIGDEIDSEVTVHEPHGALFPKSEDPLYFYRKFVTQVPTLLKPGGILLVELAHERAEETATLFKKSGTWDKIELHPDLTGRPRFLQAQTHG